MPLDRSGTVPGTVRLHIRKVEAYGDVPRSAILALSGGPGQATSPFTDQIAYLFRRPLRDRDLIVFDQRGTGRSGLIRCPTLEGLGARLFQVAGAAADCAATLGPKRAFYTTPDSVDDIEAIRRALGVERLTIYAVSYGTKVALAYATRYPQNVDRLVLDSIVDLSGPDVFALDTIAAVPRVLGALCATGCAQITRDPVGDLGALVKKLSTGFIHGPVVKSDGRIHESRLGRLRLFDLLVAGDFDPTLRAGFPAAVRSALANDPAPILRLADRADRLENDTVGSFNTAVFAATQCEEGPLPWSRSSPLASRVAAARARLDQVADSALGPFDRSTALLESQTYELCQLWPNALKEPTFATGPLPNAPALVLAGEEDLRTPVEGARAVAGRLPNATLLTVPRTGHDVLDSELAGCSRRALRNFFDSLPVSQCRPVPPLISPEPIAPTSLSQVQSVGGVGGRTGKTAGAVAMTVRDVAVQTIANGLTSDVFSFPGVGGLRAGRVKFGNNIVRLLGVVYVPGVRVSGLIRFRKRVTGFLRVSGPLAAGGALRIRKDGSLLGRLGGRRVRFLIRNDILPGGGALLSRRTLGRRGDNRVRVHGGARHIHLGR